MPAAPTTFTPRMPRPASSSLPAGRSAVVSISIDGLVRLASLAVESYIKVKEPVSLPVTSIPEPVDNVMVPSSSRTSRPAWSVTVLVKPMVTVGRSPTR